MTPAPEENEATAAAAVSPAATINLRTSSDVLEYLRTGVPSDVSLTVTVDGTATLTVEEIQGGNLNYAFAVYESEADDGGERRGERSAFVKQAPDYIKCLGEEYKLDARRAVLEGRVLRQYGQLAPDLVPRLVYMDVSNRVLVMEYLDGHAILRDVIGGEEDRVGAWVADVVEFMALTHLGTRGIEASPDLANGDMCSITSDYVFTKPFDPSDPTNRCSEDLADLAAEVRADEDVKAAMVELRTKFETSRDCLVHGDLHTGSVMVPTTAGGEGGRARVIDAEFAHVGAAAFDVGSFIAHVFFAALAAEASVEGGGGGGAAIEERRLVEAATDAWEGYRSKIATAAAADDFPSLDGLFRASMGFAGCELVRRVVGAAHAPEIDAIVDTAARTRAEGRALKLGAELMKKHGMLAGQFEEVLEMYEATR